MRSGPLCNRGSCTKALCASVLPCPNDDGIDDYIASYSHSEEGLLTGRHYDENGDGEPERSETLEYDAEGRLTRSTTYSVPDTEPHELVEYSYNPDDNSVTMVSSDAEATTPDTIHWIRYTEDGKPLEESLDEDADGSFEYTAFYTYDDDGKLTEILEDREGRSRTTFTHDEMGNLIRKTFDEGDDSVSELYERHDYSADGSLLRSEYGHQALAEGVVSDVPLYRYEYTRDERGNWTERATESFTDAILGGVEVSTYNVDGAWSSWTWTPEGSEEPTGTMNTACLGPPSPETVESF